MKLFLEDKRKQVFVKLANFAIKNDLAPIMVKLKVVSACVNSSLTYGCETWSSCSLRELEVLQRKALKLILNVYSNTPNEIIHIESGFSPLMPQIYKRQFNFFQKIKRDIAAKPYSPISRIINQILEKNLPFIRHYKKLDQKFENGHQCYLFSLKEAQQAIKNKIRTRGMVDHDSILGTYLRVNPNLESPEMYRNIKCLESERYILTKYRTGSHNLRKNNEARNEGLCTCGTDVQTIDHVLFNCNLTELIPHQSRNSNNNLNSFFESQSYANRATKLESIERTLNVKH